MANLISSTLAQPSPPLPPLFNHLLLSAVHCVHITHTHRLTKIAPKGRPMIDRDRCIWSARTALWSSAASSKWTSLAAKLSLRLPHLFTTKSRSFLSSPRLLAHRKTHTHTLAAKTQTTVSMSLSLSCSSLLRYVTLSVSSSSSSSSPYQCLRI